MAVVIRAKIIVPAVDKSRANSSSSWHFASTVTVIGLSGK